MDWGNAGISGDLVGSITEYSIPGSVKMLISIIIETMIFFCI